MRKLTINGTEHTLTTDGFSVHYVDGKTIDEFMDSLPPADINWLAAHGMHVVQHEQEHFDDIAERIEMPKDIKSALKEIGRKSINEN